jgi:hypothetical protein
MSTGLSLRAFFGAVLAALAVVTAGAGTQDQKPDEVRMRYDRLRAERARNDRTVWAQEVKAQRYGQYFVTLGDNLRSARDKYEALESAAFAGLTIPPVEVVHVGRDGRRAAQPLGPALRLDPPQFRRLLAGLKSKGYVLEQSEWHHENFQAPAGGPARSTVAMELHAANPEGQARYLIRGTLNVEWSSATDGAGNYVPALIAIDDLEILQSVGPPVFRQRFSIRVDDQSPMDDVLVHDLNGDGLSDVVYPSSNLALFNEGDFRFREERFSEDLPQIVLESVLADFTGDGRVDYLCAGVTPLRFTFDTKMRLFLYAGDGTGRFDGPPRRLGPRDLQFERPDCFAVGDVDNDGDLDLWVAQTMAPYSDERFPAPYYDANDGYASALLLNDGAGNMTDGTIEAGLESKRLRRTSRSSLVDLDQDGDLDLLVVSDFAGVDIHVNDGTGRFTDVTTSLLDDGAAFGQSHVLADFDADGRLDLFVGGVSSATGRRLERMGLGRDDLPMFQTMRPRMNHGNRLFVVSKDGRYRQPLLAGAVARSGWTSGCAALDFDLDGDVDLYVANGNQSGRSVRDYGTTFWCHDIYTAGTGPDPALAQVFADDLKPLAAGRISWSGYEHNHFFVNEGPEGFTDTAWLLGVALEEDCRSVVADDFDLDGRPDLLVVGFDRRYRFAKRNVQIYENAWPLSHSWIGVRLRGAAGVSPVGAKILVTYGGGRQLAAVVTGDSAESQHANLKHFGLGSATGIDSLEVRWPDGRVQRLESPEINRYHELRPVLGSELE